MRRLPARHARHVNPRRAYGLHVGVAASFSHGTLHRDYFPEFLPIWRKGALERKASARIMNLAVKQNLYFNYEFTDCNVFGQVFFCLAGANHAHLESWPLTAASRANSRTLPGLWSSLCGFPIRYCSRVRRAVSGWTGTRHRAPDTGATGNFPSCESYYVSFTFSWRV